MPGGGDGHCWNWLMHNIQATIPAFLIAENMSINPKSMNSTISPVQKSEIKNDWQLLPKWAGTNKMAGKN